MADSKPQPWVFFRMVFYSTNGGFGRERLRCLIQLYQALTASAPGTVTAEPQRRRLRAYLVRLRQELLHDVALPNDAYGTHCRTESDRVSGAPGGRGRPPLPAPAQRRHGKSNCLFRGRPETKVVSPARKNLLKANAFWAVSGVLARRLIQPEPPAIASEQRC